MARQTVQQASLRRNAQAVLSALARDDWATTLVAVEFFRTHLKTHGDPSTRLALEMALTREFPARTPLLLGLAEACFEAKDAARARAILWQVEQRDEMLMAAARAMGEKFLGSGEADQAQGLGVCLVVDPDMAAARGTEEVLRTCGATSIHLFSDGNACWEWLAKNPLPSLLVMEWRIPGLTGPALIQRLPTLNKGTCNVIVNSSLLKGKDLPLVEEMGVAAVLEKPTSRSQLMNCVAWCTEQAKKPTERSSIERRFRVLLKEDGINEAFGLLQVYAKKTTRDDPVLKGLEAELAFKQGDFDQAHRLAKLSIAQGNRSVVAMNLLGKSLMQLGDHAAAMQVFERANEISPKSIERLCEMAEAQTELGQGALASKSLERAETVDQESPIVITATVKIAMVTGDTALAKESLAKMPASYNIVSYVNNRAIALIKSGKYDEGIEQYSNALEALPADRHDLRAVVVYNLALAKVHRDELKAAFDLLSELELPKKMEVNLRKKVDSLLEKVRTALATGEKPRLNLLPKTASLPVVDRTQLRQLTSDEDRSARHGLYGIYKDDGQPNILVESLVANPPSLTIRKSS